jgi:hypothetical protein
MDHINAMFERDPDDVVLSEICCYGSESLSNLVCLISLRGDGDELAMRINWCISYLLAMG